jgi:hypothetical protein
MPIEQHIEALAVRPLTERLAAQGPTEPDEPDDDTERWPAPGDPCAGAGADRRALVPS